MVKNRTSTMTNGSRRGKPRGFSLMRGKDKFNPGGEKN
jgi:hypothetical protein